jgi:membrane fusion protein, multidrug efflux system
MRMSALGLAAALTAGVAGLAALSGCGETTPAPAPVRPVRHVTVQHKVVSQRLSMTGSVRAREEVNLGFRIDGKLVERLVSVGDKIVVGQVLARLDPQNEQNALRSTEADVTAAEAVLAQAQKAEARQRELLQKSFTTRAQYDQALQQLQTAQAQLDATQARLRTAQDRRSYTELRADVGGTVTAKGAEPGEVVRAGQMIVQIAREDRKDAVFDIPGQLMAMQGVPRQPVVEVAMADDPSVTAKGYLQEVAARADPVTRTFQVKIGLSDPPEIMRLGATVVGALALTSPPVIEIPSTSLLEDDGKPAAWVVDKPTQTVALRRLEVLRYELNSVIVAQGLQDGEVVVTAGVHMLRPGQKVKVDSAL